MRLSTGVRGLLVLEKKILNGRRVRSGHVQRKNYCLFSHLSQPAKLVRAKPFHLLMQTACRLKAPLGLSLLRKRGLLQMHFHKRGRNRKMAL